MKKLANLKGVRALNRMEQKSINGGGGGLCVDECLGGSPCAAGESCHHVFCSPSTQNPNSPAEYGLCVGDGENQ